MARMAAFLAASLILLASAFGAEAPKEPLPAADANSPAALERKLHGDWKGPACGGTWTFAADGAFVVEHYSPGDNRLTGNWKVKWNALPPTLVLTCQTSDEPDRLLVGQTWEVKLVQLDDENLAWQWPEDKSAFTSRYERVKK